MLTARHTDDSVIFQIIALNCAFCMPRIGGSAGIESDNYDLRVSGCGGKAQQDVYMSALQKARKV
jgi:hypothetical protein